MPDRGTNHKVLIVDDEKAICSTLGAIFMRRGYEVRSANSAEQAVEVIAEWQPDLAILDVGLPQMNGIDLAIALKASQPTCDPKQPPGVASVEPFAALTFPRGTSSRIWRVHEACPPNKPP